MADETADESCLDNRTESQSQEETYIEDASFNKLKRKCKQDYVCLCKFDLLFALK